MGRCVSCERELKSTWKFCVYCGQPFVPASEVGPELGAELELEPEAIPAAIRGEPEEPRRRKYDGAFWVGVGIGALGLVLIIYAAVQIYRSWA